MNDDDVRTGGTGREFVVTGSASLTRKPGDGRAPFAARTPADAILTGKVDPAAGNDHEAETPGADASAGESDTQTTPADYLDGLEIPPADRPTYDALGTSLSADGISNSAIHKTIAWVMARDDKVRAGEEIAVLATHKYNVSHRFQSYDVPYLNSFLNDMHDAKATQADVDLLLTWYSKHESKFASASIAFNREVDALATEHRNEARAAMRQEWGSEYLTNIRLINAHLDGLPHAEREAIEREVLPDGRQALNNPARLRELAKLARGGGPEQSSKPPGERRAEIERFMREHRQEYNRDIRTQAEYRDLISRSGDEHATQETAPSLTDAETKELQAIERFMREHRRDYDRDEVRQRRMRELYGKRGH